MILGIEIALVVYGLFGLISGTLIIWKTKVVRGARARLLGAFALLPIVAAFVLIFTVSNERTQTLIEGIVAGVVAVVVFTTGLLIGVNPDEKPPIAEEDEELVEYDDESPEDTEAAEPDQVLTDSAPSANTGPESEHLDYFDTIAEHLEYFEMKPNPEHLDYFDAKPAKPDRSSASADPLGDPAQPDRGPPRPENHTSFL